MSDFTLMYLVYRASYLSLTTAGLLIGIIYFPGPKTLIIYFPGPKTLLPQSANSVSATGDLRPLFIFTMMMGSTLVPLGVWYLDDGYLLYLDGGSWPMPVNLYLASFIVLLMLIAYSFFRQRGWRISWDSTSVTGPSWYPMHPKSTTTLDWKNITNLKRKWPGLYHLKDNSNRHIVFHTGKDHGKLLLAIGHHCPQLFPDAPT